MVQAHVVASDAPSNTAMKWIRPRRKRAQDQISRIPRDADRLPRTIRSSNPKTHVSDLILIRIRSPTHSPLEYIVLRAACPRTSPTTSISSATETSGQLTWYLSPHDAPYLSYQSTHCNLNLSFRFASGHVICTAYLAQHDWRHFERHTFQDAQQCDTTPPTCVPCKYAAATPWHIAMITHCDHPRLEHERSAQRTDSV